MTIVTSEVIPPAAHPSIAAGSFVHGLVPFFLVDDDATCDLCSCHRLMTFNTQLGNKANVYKEIERLNKEE